ncbi:MAG TPA: hypothetical protein PKI80_04655 [Deltaproteobacteria bacterium]|jgi:hypothetical protein|nr:hypothetical protein [Deltaproteobacteria bacterium]HRR21206.1 hypothetical protein [Desulfomonilia bacterium]
MMGQLRYYTRDLAFYLLLVAMMGMPAVRAYSLDLELADNPTAYLVNKAKEKRILLIGTHHRNAYIHEVIAGALPTLVEQAKINTLFVEIPCSQQPNIERFCQGLIDVDGIWVHSIVTSPSFLEILKEARNLRMNIVAIDTDVPSPIGRDEWMSRKVVSYLEEHPDEKAIVIVGARHVLKGIEWAFSHKPTLADHLNTYDTFSVVPWPDSTDSTLPVAMDITPTKFEGVSIPLLRAMNIKPHITILTVADGIILLPKAQSH